MEVEEEEGEEEMGGGQWPGLPMPEMDVAVGLIAW